MPALEEAPALPAGCVDFNKFNDACAKGSADPLKHAVIVPEAEKPVEEPAAKAHKE